MSGGRYEVRDITRMTVPLVEILWIPEDQSPAVPLVTVAARAVPKLAEALNSYLAGSGSVPVSE